MDDVYLILQIMDIKHLIFTVTVSLTKYNRYSTPQDKMSYTSHTR